MNCAKERSNDSAIFTEEVWPAVLEAVLEDLSCANGKLSTLKSILLLPGLCFSHRKQIEDDKEAINEVAC